MKSHRLEHYSSHSVISEASRKLMKFCSNDTIPEEIRRFDVVLDEPNQIFFSGHSVNGQVRIDLDTCLTVQGIIVRFVGEAVVSVAEETGHWVARQLRSNLRRNKISPGVVDSSIASSDQMTESPERCRECRLEEDWAKSGVPPRARPRPRSRPRQRQTKFRSSERYFEHKFYVFGHKYSSRREQLWAGAHRFPFQYTLPSKLPASFHGRFGYVRYFCEASLERSGQPSLQRRALFSVSNVADINAEPKAESGAYEQRSTNSCLFCCKNGTVIASAKLKKTGFASGEELIISADVINMSNRPIYKTCAKIKQVVTYISSKGFRTHVDEATVNEARRGPIISGDSDNWEDVPLLVPPLPPTSRFTNCCKVLDVDYRLDFCVELEGEPLEIRLPLWIGTIPLQKEFPNLQPGALDDEMHDRVLFPTATLVKFSDLPAVFSEPCVWGPRPVDGYFGRTAGARQVDRGPGVRASGRNWAVRYPTYRLRPPQEGTLQMLLRQAATNIPKIVITRPPGCCTRHHHVTPPPDDPARRHSAPEQLVEDQQMREALPPSRTRVSMLTELSVVSEGYEPKI